ncbi:MAG: hypothetical protein HFG15_01120 [Bacilli bacterium]|nr:hypothetical protein [Bacilli bacterium]
MMKKLFHVFLSLLILYFILSMIMGYFSQGHEVTYQLLRRDDEITIHEKMVRRTKQEIDHYYFDIEIGDMKFSYQILDDFHQKKEIIDDIKYLSDHNYQCFLPVFKGETILTDIICKGSDDIYYPYQSIDQPSKKLKTWVQSLEKHGYDKRQYQDRRNVHTTVDLLTFYSDNQQENFEFGITSYKGIYIFDQKMKNVELFDHDVYQRELSAFVGEYYVVANYNESYDFNTFYMVRLKDGKQQTITTNQLISHDSYLAGVVGDEVYIIDRGNKRQYVLSTSKKTIKEIGNEADGMRYYEKGSWTTVPSTRFTLQETKFDVFMEKTQGSMTLFMEGEGAHSGYRYYYQKMGKEYRIYRANKQNEMVKTYLFTTDHIERIQTGKHYIFYQVGNEIHYYHDQTGNRTFIADSELEFNPDILYGVYEK